jgi:hypothetical protein
MATAWRRSVTGSPSPRFSSPSLKERDTRSQATRAALYDEAKRRDIKGRSRMTRGELEGGGLRLLRGHARFPVERARLTVERLLEFAAGHAPRG